MTISYDLSQSVMKDRMVLLLYLISKVENKN